MCIRDRYYVQEIERVGTVEQNAVKDFYIIKSKIEFRDETTGSSIIVLPDENFSLNVLDVYKRQLICIGKKPATYPFGKVLRRTL